MSGVAENASEFANDHPTNQCHSPFTPWACELGEGEQMKVRCDCHRDCRRCVLAMGASIVGGVAKWRQHHHLHPLSGPNAEWVGPYTFEDSISAYPERAS